MRPRYIRVLLVQADHNDLICVHCGDFGTEWAIISRQSGADSEPFAGVHTKCLHKLHARREVKPKTSTNGVTSYARAEAGFPNSRSE